MNSQNKMWLIIGIFLLMLGLISSLMQQGERPGPRERVETTRPPARPLRPDDVRQFLPAEPLEPDSQVAPREPERTQRDRLLRVDPIRGIRKDEEDVRYFQ